MSDTQSKPKRVAPARKTQRVYVSDMVGKSLLALRRDCTTATLVKVAAPAPIGTAGERTPAGTVPAGTTATTARSVGRVKKLRSV